MATMWVSFDSTIKSIKISDYAGNQYNKGNAYTSSPAMITGLPENSGASKSIWIKVTATLASGYSWPCTEKIYENGSLTSTDTFTSSCNYTIKPARSIDLSNATKSGTTYTTHLIYFRTGTGIDSYTMEYANSTTSENTISVTSSTSSVSAYVRDSTYATLKSYTPSPGYSSSYYFTEYTNSNFNMEKGTISGNGIYSNGTRYIKLCATPRSKLTVDSFSSILYSVKVTDGTFTSSNLSIYYSSQQEITQVVLTGDAINKRWTGNIYWKSSSGSRYLVATVTNGSVSLASSIEPIDCTGDRTISFVAEGSYNTGVRVYLRCGVGVSSYTVQYTDYDGIVTNKTISSNTYIDAKKNSTIYASAPDYAAYYEGPYYFQQWSTDFGSVTSSNIGTDVSVGSTSLYLKLAGTHRKWKVTYNANGGTWTSSVTNPELVEYLDKASIADYSAAVSRENYKLLGWFTSATGGNQWAATNVVSQDMTLYAHWELTIATITLQGNGGLWGGNLQYRTIKKDVGEILQFADYGPNATPPLQRAYYTLAGWSANPDTSPDNPTYGVNGYVTVGATDATYYAIWKNSIKLFYWGDNSDRQDATIIAKGLPISNLTADRWNSLKAKVKEIASAYGNTAAVQAISSNVSSGDTITADEYNGVRICISLITNHGTLPAAATKGGPIYASYFNGTTSLKSALNAAITAWNDS